MRTILAFLAIALLAGCGPTKAEGQAACRSAYPDKTVEYQWTTLSGGLMCYEVDWSDDHQTYILYSLPLVYRRR